MTLSDNAVSADNQQGRLNPWYIVGFTDGEGCFAISIFKNATSRLGYQVFPEFVVTQGAKSSSVLEALQSYFGCGAIYENRRTDNHKESLYRYCVRSQKDIREKIIPFFEKYQLRTAKQFDFEMFQQGVTMLERKEHLTPDGLEAIRSLASLMNQRKNRNLEPSETTRQTLTRKVKI